MGLLNETNSYNHSAHSCNGGLFYFNEVVKFYQQKWFQHLSKMSENKFPKLIVAYDSQEQRDKDPTHALVFTEIGNNMPKSK